MKSLIAFLSTIRWQDLVDIVINSYILFRVYVLFQGTNAFRVLVGITLLWILQEVAASIGLILTSWAIRGITAAAAIIIIVVFRNEIRTALQIRNLKTFLWGSPNRQEAAPLEVIAETAFQMGKKRIGALMVFPGKEDLTEVIHGGIRWNGTVSQEMLMSIFWPKNPVHDGAIIIDGNHVVEVGVLLPLSQRQDLPTYYGTRHRAAAGLAERTDALVVIVSEERGRVTIAKDDLVKTITHPDELVQALKRHLNMYDDVPAKFQKKRRFKLATAAVLSLLIMTGIWFGFTRSQDTIVALNVPVEYLSRPTAYEILDTSTDEARLQLYGSSALVRSLRQGQVQVQVDLSKATEGKNTYTITQDNIVLPPGVFLHKVDPPVIEVTLDRHLTKELPIQVDWTGNLPDNLTVTEVNVIPESIRVIGGSKTLESVKTLYTAPIRLDTLPKSGSITTTVVLTPASLRVAPNSTDRVLVTYSLEERQNSQKESP